MIGEVALGTALAAGGYWLFDKLQNWSRRRAASARQNDGRFNAQVAERTRQQRVQQLQQQRQRQQAAARMKTAAKSMQISLLQLRQAPDFRRAAGFAELARCVPLSFRQRQFRRFRPQIVSCLAQRLHAGIPAEQATDGLTELVTGLGIAAYEAEYLLREAQGQTTRAPAPALSFADQVRQSQAEHRQRVETIQNTEGLDPDLREQLLELEQQRLRDQLLGNADESSVPGL